MKDLDLAYLGEKEILILRSVINFLVERLTPYKIILFGSRAKRMMRKGSDFDIAIEGHIDLSPREERKLKECVDRLAGIYSFDLVFLDHVDKNFKRLVKETGVTLYEKS